MKRLGIFCLQCFGLYVGLALLANLCFGFRTRNEPQPYVRQPATAPMPCERAVRAADMPIRGKSAAQGPKVPALLDIKPVNFASYDEMLRDRGAPARQAFPPVSFPSYCELQNGMRRQQFQQMEQFSQGRQVCQPRERRPLVRFSWGINNN